MSDFSVRTFTIISRTSATASWRYSAEVSRVWKSLSRKDRASNLSHCKHELTAPALVALKDFLHVSGNTIVAKSCGGKMFHLLANFSNLCHCKPNLVAKTTLRSPQKIYFWSLTNHENALKSCILKQLSAGPRRCRACIVLPDWPLEQILGL